MKKLLLILILSFFLVPFTTWAINPAFLGMIGSGSTGCGGTQTFVGNPGDTETFEYQADDFCCTEFSVTDPDGIISTHENAQVKNGSYAASFAFDGNDTRNDNWIKVNLGAGDGDFTNDFWFWPHDYNDAKEYYIFTATEVDNSASSSRGYRLKHKHNYTGSWELKVIGGTNDISIGLTSASWHRIEVDYNQNAASTIKIYNASDVLQDTLNFTASNYAPQYLFWGCIFGDVDARATNYLDDIRFKSGGGGF